MRAFVIALAVVGLSTSSWAETIGAAGSRSAHEAGSDEERQEHAHQPRHGGYFGDADDLYHYEVLLQDERQLVLYVNDELNRPLSVRGLKGQWTLNPGGDSPMRGSFTPSPDGAYFLAQLPSTDADPLHVEVAVLKGRQWVRMEFYLPVLPSP